MEQIPAESVVVSRAFAVFWVVVFSAILVIGRGRSGMHEFRGRMLQQWNPALIIALLHLLGAGFGGYGFLQVSSIGYFCQAMIPSHLRALCMDFCLGQISTAHSGMRGCWRGLGG